MAYLFLVEDELYQIFEILLNRVFSENSATTRPERKIRRVHQGDMANPTRIERIINSFQRKINKVYILRDSECTPHDVTKSFLNNRLSPLLRAYPDMIRICIITHAIESWLLYDEVPLKQILRTRVYRCPTTIEVEDASNDCCHPKEFIRNEFRKHNVDFNIIHHGEQIAHELDLRKLERSRSFKEFKDNILRDLMTT